VVPIDTGIVRDADGRVVRRYGKPGTWDLDVTLPPDGHHLVIEIKTGRGRANAAQLRAAEGIVAAGGTRLEIHDSVAELEAWLTHYGEETRNASDV
jgi:hypothetical protein